MSTDYRALCAELLSLLDNLAMRNPEMDGGMLRHRARTALAQPEPVALTVQECDDMRKHRGNYIYEYCDGIELDGCFSREDLLELARTIAGKNHAHG